MAITSRDTLISALASSFDSAYMKVSATTVAGFWYSLFRTAGMPGAAATATTGSGNTCSRTLAGALNIPAASNTTYLMGYNASSTIAGTLRISDRLVETSGLSLVTTGNQTVNTVTLPTRASSGVGVELWLDIIAAGGTTASATVTCTYYNQNGSGDGTRTATLVGGIPATGTPVNRNYQFALQAGDTGVTQALTFSSGTSTTTAGNAGIVLRRSLAQGVCSYSNGGFTQGYAETALQVVPDAACLEFQYLSTTTTSGSVQGLVVLGQI